MLLALVALSVVPAAAGAVPAKERDAAYLGALWTKVLETPSAQNSFGTGGPAFGCFYLGHTLAPLGPPPGVPSCETKPGTEIFVTAASVECSTFPEDHIGFGTTFQERLSCARQGDAQVAPSVSVDGTAVPVSEVETGPLNIVLPAHNIRATRGNDGLSAAHGWVVLLHPLPPGTHTIVLPTITTTIVVDPHG
jgi:hypothetical protein